MNVGPPYRPCISTVLSLVASTLSIAITSFSRFTEIRQLQAFIIDNALTSTECTTLLAAAEASGPWQRAMKYVVQRIRNRVRLFVPDIARLDRQAELTGGSAIIWGEVWEVSTDDNILQGGVTTFHSRNMKRRYDVLPKTDRVLIFQHKTSDIRVMMLFKVSSTQ